MLVRLCRVESIVDDKTLLLLPVDIEAKLGMSDMDCDAARGEVGGQR